MRYGEPIAALRQIPVYLIDAARAPVIGAAPSGSELQVSKSGAAWATAGGVWTEVGLGAYTYEASKAETQTGSFLLLRVAATGARVYVYAVDIGDGLVIGAEAEARRVPIYLVDEDGDEVTGLTLSGSEVQISIAGAAWATGTGTAAEIGLGAYYYELAEGELDEGIGMLRVSDAGAQVYVYTWDVTPAAVALAEGTAPLLADPEYAEGLVEIDHITAAIRRLPHMHRGVTR